VVDDGGMGLRHLGVVLLLGGACTSTGAAGASSLIFTTDEPPGANCPAGGIRVDHGQDLDENGLLTGDEIKGTGFVCDGPIGTMGGMGTSGRPALVAMSDETAGANCAAGGKRIDYGVDDDGDNTLDTGEIDGTQYVCNGANGPTGANGHQSLMLVDTAVGTNCQDTGQRIRYGIDDNGNNVLDLPAEGDGEFFVCNGISPTAQINALDTRVTTLEGRGVHTAVIAGGASPSIVRQNDNWIASVSRPQQGQLMVSFTSGTFTTGLPTCVAQLISYPGNTASGTISLLATTTQGLQFNSVCSGTSCTGLWDTTFNLVCVPY
jgi:hypothetical protein